VIDLGLGRAEDLERDRLVERELRAAVERDEPLPCEQNSTVITDPASRPKFSP
jgi:hypothetical protein